MNNNIPTPDGNSSEQSLDTSTAQLKNKAHGNGTDGHRDGTDEGQGRGDRRRKTRFRCKQPRLVRRKSDGEEVYVRCRRPSCAPCLLYRAFLVFLKIRARIEAEQGRPDKAMLLMCTFNQAAQDRGSARHHSTARAAATAALVRARRPRSGSRAAAGWPGVRLEYVRSVGVCKSGILHLHHVLFVWPLPGGVLPSVGELRSELLVSYRDNLDLRYVPSGGVNLIDLQECRSAVAVARYITVKQKPVMADEARGIRRQQMSRGFMGEEVASTAATHERRPHTGQESR